MSDRNGGLSFTLSSRCHCSAVTPRSQTVIAAHNLIHVMPESPPCRNLVSGDPTFRLTRRRETADSADSRICWPAHHGAFTGVATACRTARFLARPARRDCAGSGLRCRFRWRLLPGRWICALPGRRIGEPQRRGGLLRQLASSRTGDVLFADSRRTPEADTFRLARFLASSRLDGRVRAARYPKSRFARAGKPALARRLADVPQNPAPAVVSSTPA